MLKRKLWRDLIKNKTQFISIFLMSFLGLFVFVGLDAEGNGLEVNSKAYYEETNMADLWVMGKNFTEEDCKAIEKISGINSVSRRLQINTTADLASQPYVQLNFVDNNDVSRMYLKSGAKFNEEEEGIWLDELFAKGQNLEIGDTITLKFNGVEIVEEIKGLIIHPEYVYFLEDEGELIPDYGSYGYGFLSGKEFPMQNQLVYSQMLVDTANTSNVATIKSEMKNALDFDNLVITDRKQNLSYATFDSERQQHITMGIMFPMVFLLIAVLGIITTMTRMTTNQRIQIGTLKALGFSKRIITRHYMSYGFTISLVGALLGAYLGFAYLPLFFIDSMKDSYTLPTWGVHLSNNSYIAIAANVLVSTLASYLACRNELKDPPAETLRPAAPKKNKDTFIEKSFLWNRLSFSAKWNFRDIVRNKMRTLMGIVGVVGCTMLLVCAFGFRDSIIDMPTWLYGELMTCKTKIIFEQTASEASKIDYANQYAGQLIEENAIELVVNDVMKTGSITIFDNGNYLHFQDEKLNPMHLSENGVAVSYKMAKNLGVEVGDFIEWHVVGETKWEKTRVEQLYRTPAGQGISMNRETFEKLEHTFSPTAVLSNKSAESGLIDKDDIQGVQNINQMRKDMDESLEMMNIMVGILIVAAVILGMVVLYNLGVLSFVEKTREIATLKVLGFSSRKIRAILRTQNIWVTIAGIMIGIPTGYLFLIALCTSMSESQDMLPIVTLQSYLYAIAGTFLVSMFVNSILSLKVKTIDMVDALKGVE